MYYYDIKLGEWVMMYYLGIVFYFETWVGECSLRMWYGDAILHVQ